MANEQGMRKSVMTIQDYVDMSIDEKTQYTIMGVIKPRSIKLASGINKKFVITDSVNDLQCKYDGETPTEVKEGDTAIVTAICPNVLEKNSIVVKSYITKHSMELNEWKTKNNVSSKSYGLEKYK